MAQKKKSPRKKPQARAVSMDMEQFAALVGTGKVGVPRVTPDSAITISAVFCAITQIANAIAKMPLITYRRKKDGGKERAHDHELYSLLHRSPNGVLSAYEFKEMITWDVLVRGDFFSRIAYRGDGSFTLSPVRPDIVRVLRVKGSPALMYEISVPDSAPVTVSSAHILHVRGAGSDGVHGKAIVLLGSESLGRQMAMSNYATDFFANGSTPLGILEYPHALTKERRKELAQEWEERHRGGGNTHKVAVLEAGMKWQALGMSNEQSQFLESRKFEIEDVARWFCIPPHMLMHLDNATFSNIEHQRMEFYENTVLPVAKRIEGALNLALLGTESDGDVFVEFLFDSLLIADTKTRYEAHNLALQCGWKSRNEIRVIENLERVEGLDGYMVPLNMGKVDGSTEEEEQEELAPEKKEMLAEAVATIVEVAFDPISRREDAALEKCAKKPWSDQEFEEFYSRQEKLALVPCIGVARSLSRLLGVWEPTNRDVSNVLRFVFEQRRKMMVVALRSDPPRVFPPSDWCRSEFLRWLREEWETRKFRTAKKSAA